MYLKSGEELFYPLVITLWDLGWLECNAGNLEKLFNRAPAAVCALTKEYLEFVTSNAAGDGQEIAKTKSEYFAPLPIGGVGTAAIRETHT